MNPTQILLDALAALHACDPDLSVNRLRALADHIERGGVFPSVDLKPHAVDTESC